MSKNVSDNFVMVPESNYKIELSIDDKGFLNIEMKECT